MEEDLEVRLHLCTLVDPGGSKCVGISRHYWNSGCKGASVISTIIQLIAGCPAAFL